MNTEIKFPWAKDIEPHFQFYIPSMLNILMPSMKQIRCIEKKYTNRYNMHRHAIIANGLFEAETTIFELLWKAKEGDINSLAFLRFIEKICSSLISKLEIAQINKLRQTCYQAIINFERSKSKYLCYIGELASLERILSRSEHKLIDVEYKMPNGKYFDFAIEINSMLHVIEVLNIFLNSEAMEEEENFRKFMEKRFIDKLVNKTDGIPEKAYCFALLPILWGEFNKLKKYIKFFQTFNPPKKIVLPPMMISSFENIENGDIEFSFMDVKQYLEFLDKKTNKIGF